MKIRKILKEIVKEIYFSKNRNFLSLASRPSMSEEVRTESYYEQKEKVGIIIQGGIWEDYHFTYETVKLYNKLYPEAIVILSTWSDTPKNVLAEFSQLHVEVVITEKPEPIVGNANLQVLSSRNGILKAKELGCKYVCKSRTDQRMYANDALAYAIKLIEKYPIKDNFDALGRIVAIGSNTFRNRLYDINDMWLFGHSDDILKYWMCDQNMQWGVDVKNTPKIIETFACTEYLKKIGYKLAWTYDDSINVYATLFIIIDTQSIDLYWVKRASEYINKRYDTLRNIEFSHRDWFLMQ